MNCRKLLIATTLLIWSYGASAQWQWIDETGRKVFSDRPPPTHIPAKNIVKQPPGGVSTHNIDQIIYSSDSANADAKPAAAAPAPTAAEELTKEQEKLKQEDEAQSKAIEEAQRKAQAAEEKKQAAKIAQQRKDNCQRARTVQTTLNSGRLLGNVNEKGERGIMTEKQRQLELQRTQKAIRDNC